MLNNSKLKYPWELSLETFGQLASLYWSNLAAIARYHSRGFKNRFFFCQDPRSCEFMFKVVAGLVVLSSFLGSWVVAFLCAPGTSSYKVINHVGLEFHPYNLISFFRGFVSAWSHIGWKSFNVKTFVYLLH